MIRIVDIVVPTGGGIWTGVVNDARARGSISIFELEFLDPDGKEAFIGKVVIVIVIVTMVLPTVVHGNEVGAFLVMCGS